MVKKYTFILCFILGLLSLMPSLVFGLVTVSNTNDSGPGSLRQALADAASGETIDFSVTGTITLTSVELTISQNQTITGPGAGSLTIDGNNNSRIFNIDSSGATVNISGLTLINGNSTNYGGGIENVGTLNINDCVISGCDANGFGNGYGGAIDNYGGTVNITTCTISGNTAITEGGGIRNENGTVTITESTISGNTSDNGGGIGNYSTTGSTVEVIRSTIYDNHATSGGNRYGGGIISNGGTLTLTNSTISGNDAVSGGGGIIDGAAAAITITQCTITGNTSTNGGGGIDLGNSTANIKNTILAGNTGGDGNNYYSTGGTLNSQGYNLEDATEAGFTGTGDIQNGTIGLDAIADNGGPTRTHALQTTSDAVDGIPEGGTSYNGAPATDQRGISRPQSVNVDIGAFELEQAPQVTTQAVSGIGTTSATGNGTITSLGAPNPTAHGMVWNTTGTPTTADNSTDEGAAAATGPFTSNMTGLSPYTTYYVRAYATNANGTAYGNEVSFMTAGIVPTVTTQAVSGIGTTTAVGNGTITNLGVPNPTAHGVVWNTTGTPTLADSSTNEGAAAAAGAFTTNMAGLSPNTTYYVRAYATNAQGTSYGGEVNFATDPQAPTVTTQAVSSIGTTTAVGNGTITNLGVPNPTAHGVVWNTTGTPTTADSSTNEGAAAAAGAFTSNMTGLSPNTTYYVRAYATNTAGTVYGGEVNFTTDPQAPTVTTQAVSGISATTAVGNGTITNLGAPNPTAHGVVWNTTGTPTTADSSTNEGAAAAAGAFTSNMTGLSPNTTYYVRAYATNTAGTVYGGEVNFTTDPQAPTVTTQAVTGIGTTTAVGNGTITSLGGPNPTAHGVVWNTTGTPTTADSSTNEGAAAATGAFTSNMTGLSAGVTYYVRAYATNTAGTVYGNEVSFNTATTAPTVTTQAVTGIGTTTATGNGTITGLGEPNPTAHGVVWNTTGTPTTADSSTNEGAAASTGAFTTNMTGLSPNTTYYVRAYATNANSTVYGGEVPFTTNPAPPTVTTQAVSGIGTTSATGNGNITYLGAPNPTAHGVVWNTTGTPTLADNSTNEGAAVAAGAFTSNMTGLTPNTTYYVRAYATNTVGTSYGGEVSFTTAGGLPTVITTAVSGITSSSAESGGNVTDNGGSGITARGVCWDTSPNPTIAGNRTTNGIGTGTFTSNITGLTENTTYYVRAYATNSQGTAYGEELNFTTNAESVTVTITEPEDGAVVSGTVDIKATTTSNPTNARGASPPGVSKVEFYIDDSKIAEDAAEPYETHWDTTPYTDGFFTIKAIAYNLANETAEDEITVQVNNAPPEILLNRTRLNVGSTPGPGNSAGTASIMLDSIDLVTGPQTILINNSGGGTLNWAISRDAEWLTCTPETGTGPGAVTISANPSGLAAGAYTAAITVRDPNASNSPQTVPVTLKVYHSGTTVPPFGYFETPIDGSTVMSSVPVTGWALDDIEVSSVKIYRAPIPGQETDGLVYIGDAVFVDGARPDVEQAFPGYPRQFRAGWGYMMLTNFLPNQGNGTFTIYAKAVDKEGHEVTLGIKTITCDNANAVKPFGAIDTPGQGGIASGHAYVNFGWALTPQPNTIPTDGSTITVWVDGVPLGSPVYNQYREDIATLFPGYTNSHGAIGYYYIDTAMYTNGVHTIAWSAEDNAGNTDGIGSRYFSIRNIGGSSLTLQDSKSKTSFINISRIQQITTSTSPIFVKKGYRTDTIPEIFYPDDKGIITIMVKEDERVEIQLSVQNAMNLSSSHRYSYSGCSLFGQHTRPLPPGSFIDKNNGIFYWQLGPAFFGEHLLVFLEKGPDGETSKQQVKVIIRSKYKRL
jgi:hypothetical protein